MKPSLNSCGVHQLFNFVCVLLTHFYRAGHVRRLGVTYFTSTIVVLTMHFESRYYARRKCVQPPFVNTYIESKWKVGASCVVSTPLWGKYPGIAACFACVTRTPIELSMYFYLAYSERAPGVQIVAVRS